MIINFFYMKYFISVKAYKLLNKSTHRLCSSWYTGYVERNIRLSEKYIRSHYETINFRYLFQGGYVPLNIIKNSPPGIEITWGDLNFNPRFQLTEDIIRKCLHQITFAQWKHISYRLNLTDKFLNDFSLFIDWSIQLQYHKKSIPTLHKYHRILDWNMVSKYQPIDDVFINKYHDKINYRLLGDKCQNLSNEFIKKNLKLLNVEYVFSNRVVSPDLVANNLSHISIETYRMYYPNSSYGDYLNARGIGLLNDSNTIRRCHRHTSTFSRIVDSVCGFFRRK